MNASCKLNPEFQKAWRAAIGDIASLTGKDDPENIHKLVQQSAGRFLKNVAAITPPAIGTLDSAAKARGEQAVLDDLLKIAIPVTAVGSPRAARAVLATAQDLMDTHASARSGVAGGRVNPRNSKKLFIEQSAFNRVVADLQKRVGWLAAGLNAAAAKLGVRLPAWITRHGEKFGRIEVRATDAGILVRITQNVPYTDDVKDYSRKWDFALQKEIKSLLAQAKHIADKKCRKAQARFR